MKLIKEQPGICQRYSAVPIGVQMRQKVGVSEDALRGLRPIQALRHFPEGDTCGWYIWAGEELSGNPDFFLPFHVEHLENLLPEIVKYLALSPGWRVLIDPPEHEDVWYDELLIK